MILKDDDKSNTTSSINSDLICEDDINCMTRMFYTHRQDIKITSYQYPNEINQSEFHECNIIPLSENTNPK